MERKIERVGLVGWGYWGKKIAKTLHELEVLKGITDISFCGHSALDRETEYSVPWFELSGDLIMGLQLDAVVIATPPENHYEMAFRCLNSGLHTFVEKPLTTDYEQAMELENLAHLKGVHLAVGHIYLHNPGFKNIPRPVGNAGLFVKLLNVGGAPSNSTRDILWAGLPHAVSMAVHFFPSEPVEVDVYEKSERAVKVRLDYWDGSSAYLHVGDHTGRRVRGVQLRVESGHSYHFDADSPNHLWERRGSLGIQVNTETSKDPLTLELEAFLGKVASDVKGSDVVKIIERIRDESGAEGGN